MKTGGVSVKTGGVFVMTGKPSVKYYSAVMPDCFVTVRLGDESAWAVIDTAERRCMRAMCP